MYRYPTAGGTFAASERLSALAVAHADSRIGQYHWVAALAPPRMRKFLSYTCCCILTFTWLTFLGAAAWFFGLDVSAITLLNTGEYHTWITFTAAACVMVASCVVNITWGRHMNIPETFVLVVHFVAFILLLSLLCDASAKGIVSANFTVTSATGWSPNFGVLLSTLYATNSLAGFDCAAHIGMQRHGSTGSPNMTITDNLSSRRYLRCRPPHSAFAPLVDQRECSALRCCGSTDLLRCWRHRCAF